MSHWTRVCAAAAGLTLVLASSATAQTPTPPTPPGPRALEAVADEIINMAWIGHLGAPLCSEGAGTCTIGVNRAHCRETRLYPYEYVRECVVNTGAIVVACTDHDWGSQYASYSDRSCRVTRNGNTVAGCDDRRDDTSPRRRSCSVGRVSYTCVDGYVPGSGPTSKCALTGVPGRPG
jgi:hypothetical protein